MERLLDQVDTILLTADEESGPENRPNFEVPTELVHLTEQPPVFLQLMDNPQKGMGWFAKQPITAGTILMVAKPISWAMDSEVPDEYDDDEMEDDEEDAAK